MLLLVESVSLLDHSGLTGRSVFLTVVSQVTCMCERHESSQIFGEKQGRCRWLTVRTRLRDEAVSACGGSVAAGEESAGSRSCCKTSTNVENKQQEVLPPRDHVRPADLAMLQGISDDYRDLSQIEAFLY